MFIFIWLLFGVIGAIIGNPKGRGGDGFLLGILFGPIGILIILVIKGNRKTCPFCKELINKEAVRCSRCQKELVSTMDNPNQIPTIPPKKNILKQPAFWVLLILLILIILLLV